MASSSSASSSFSEWCVESHRRNASRGSRQIPWSRVLDLTVLCAFT